MERSDYMKSAEGLVSFAQAALNAGVGYVYGTFGQICTSALLDQKARQYPDDDLAGGTMRQVGNKWVGRHVVDCIGLLKYYLMADKFGDDPSYIAAYDHGANQHFAESHENGPIDTLPEIPGLCLHMDGHVGYYIGGGYAIEAAGTREGVIKTRVRGRGWDHWYKSIFLDYSAGQPADYVKFDTSALNLRHGDLYILKTTSAQHPVLNQGKAGVVQLLPHYRDGNDEYWYIVGVGKPGDGVGIYCNGQRRLVVNIK